MVFGNGVKNIQAAAYNGARPVYISEVMPITYFFPMTVLCCRMKIHISFTKL